jgi:hypothetical protein
MTDDRERDPHGADGAADQDSTTGPAGDALRSTRDDLSPEHDQPVEGGVEQAEEGAGPPPEG